MSGGSTSLCVRAALVAALLSLAAPSHAFRLVQNNTTGVVTAGFPVACDDPGGFAHWASANINFLNNPAGGGSGKEFSLGRAMASWTAVANADHALQLQGATNAGFNGNDGINSLSWGTGNGCSGSCLALTSLRLTTGQVIVEADVTFNDGVTWKTDGTDFDTEAVAAHELGHVLGIHHTDQAPAASPTMTALYFGNAGRTLEADDTDALVCSQGRFPPAAAAPAAPLFLTVSPDFCWGVNEVEWGLSAGATRYELYRSTSPSFATQTLAYSGPGTFKAIGVQTTTYLRVRACNAAGCGPYRVGDRPARYYFGCE